MPRHTRFDLLKIGIHTVDGNLADCATILILLAVSGPTIDLITNLSGSLFGISALAAGLSSSMEGKEHLSVPLAEPTARTKLADAFTRMEDELNSLFSKIQAVRASVEEEASNAP